jgi:SynChlorMet cassette radical SAM/SPASM protein ScmE
MERTCTSGTDGQQVPGHLSAPVSADVSVTGRCNLHCRYCFYSDEMVSLSDLSTEEWKKAFGKLGGAKVLKLTLTGGEPFARKDIFSLIDSVVENRMRYSILSNGTLLDGETVRRLGEGRRRTRMDSIQVSIDGSTARVHNRSRPESFESALAGLKLLLENGFPVSVRVTISRHNMDDLDGIARLLIEDIGLRSFSTCDASPIGMGCTYGRELALDHREILAVGLKLERLLSRYPGGITAQAGPLANLRMYREMEEAMEKGSGSGRWKMGCLSSCGGVFERLAILHDGSVVPCSMLHDMKMGSILTDDLLALWNESPLMEEVRRRYCVPLSSIPECRGCRWTEICNGGCPGVVRQMRGTILAPDRRNCYRDFLEANGLKRVPGPL